MIRRIEYTHKSRQAAAEHLTERGWVRGKDSFGDWTFTHPQIKTHRNIIVALKNGMWQIQAWGGGTY
jgi:hypothetical protein